MLHHPSPELAEFYSATVAGFYSGVDTIARDVGNGTNLEFVAKAHHEFLFFVQHTKKICEVVGCIVSERLVLVQ